MSSYRAKPREWWETETAWIETEGRKVYRMAAFASYCAMQARFAEKDGFPDLAERIREAHQRRS